MKNKFENYYKKMEEDAGDVVSEIYDDLIEDLKEPFYGSVFNNWLRLNEDKIREFNINMELSLREAVEIIEQSNREVLDEELWIHAGDCREQVKMMGYWTYVNDLMEEFKIALKAKLQSDFPVFEEEFEKVECLMNDLQEMIDEKEEEKDELEMDIIGEEDDAVFNSADKKIVKLEKEIEDLEKQKQKLEEEMEEPVNLVDNVRMLISEL